MKALSIRQPWAWLIVKGHKDIENRTWSTSYRGEILIHASKTIDKAAMHMAISRGWKLPDFIKTGGIIGMARIDDCVESSDSGWFQGPYGFRLSHQSQLPFHPCPGKLGIFELPDYIPGTNHADRN